MAATVLRRVRVEMRPEGGKAVGGAGSPCGEGADAPGSVISAESAPCEVLDVGKACWATLVAAAGDSAEPVPSPEGTAEAEVKAVSAAGNNYLRPGRQSSVVTAAVARTTNLPKKARGSSILKRGPCVGKSPRIRRGEREHTQNSALGVGYPPIQTNTGGLRGPDAKPAAPNEEDTAIFHGHEAANSSAVVFCGRLWQTGPTIGISVGAALAVLEGVVERCENL